MEHQLKHNIAAVGARGGIAARLSLFGCDHSFAARRHVDPIEGICLIADQLTIRCPGEIGVCPRPGDRAALGTGSGSGHHEQVPAVFAQNRRERMSSSRNAEIHVSVGIAGDGRQLAIRIGDERDLGLIEIGTLAP